MPAARLLAAAVAAAVATGRVFQASWNGADPDPLIAKFAFGVDPSGAAVGKLTMDYSTSQQQLTMQLFDDDAWQAVYSGDYSCQQQMSAATDQMTLSSLATSAYRDFVETQRPHYWYFTVSNAPNCDPAVVVSYTLTLTQADGSQLSYDELGLPAAYAVFFVLFLLGTAVHCYRHYLHQQKFRPWLVVLTTVAGVSMSLSLLVGAIVWGIVSNTGFMNTGLLVTQFSLRLLAHMALWTVAALAANGYGVTTYALASRDNIAGVAVLVVILIAYIGGLVFRAAGYEYANPNADVSGWPTVLLLVLTVVFAAWFVFRIRRTIIHELRMDKRFVLWRLALVLGAQFLIHPITETIAAVTPEYDRLKVHVAVEYCLVAACLGALMFVLWPSEKTISAFRVMDGTHKLWLDAHGEDAATILGSDGFGVGADAATGYYGGSSDGVGGGTAGAALLGGQSTIFSPAVHQPLAGLDLAYSSISFAAPAAPMSPALTAAAPTALGTVGVSTAPLMPLAAAPGSTSRSSLASTSAYVASQRAGFARMDSSIMDAAYYQ